VLDSTLAAKAPNLDHQPHRSFTASLLGYVALATLPGVTTTLARHSRATVATDDLSRGSSVLEEIRAADDQHSPIGQGRCRARVPRRLERAPERPPAVVRLKRFDLAHCLRTRAASYDEYSTIWQGYHCVPIPRMKGLLDAPQDAGRGVVDKGRLPRRRFLPGIDILVWH
jgi:hypothetical protein